MNFETLSQRLAKFSGEPFLYDGDSVFLFCDLIEEIDNLSKKLSHQIPQGSVVTIEGDYSLTAVAMLLVGLKHSWTVVPISDQLPESQIQKRIRLASANFRFECCSRTIKSLSLNSNQDTLIEGLNSQGRSGLIFYTSGTTGEPKGIVHDFELQLSRFEKAVSPRSLILFLMFDHFGGVLSLFHALTSGGKAVVLRDRSPSNVLGEMQRHQVSLLPTSPTFLNNALISGDIDFKQLQWIKTITYGTEPMPDATLSKIKSLLPETQIRQTYGATETGSIEIRDHATRANWFKVVDPVVETKVVNNILYIRSTRNFLGYLGGKSSMDSQGYYCTNDVVETDDGYLRVLGRSDGLINVGGEKVFPNEVENVLLQVEGVRDAIVRSRSHPLTGEILVASVQITSNVAEAQKITEIGLKKYCQQRLPMFKIPVEITITSHDLAAGQIKKMRSLD